MCFREISPLTAIWRVILRGASLEVRRPQLHKARDERAWARKVTVGVERSKDIGEILTIKTDKI